jgi:hypothetical protein
MATKARSRPSPAMVVACVALSFALAGSALAGTQAVTSAVNKAKVKKIAKKQANKQITNRAPGLAVRSADTANRADTATQLANVTYVKGLETSIPADGQTHLLNGAICPAGSNVVGGGLLGSFLFRVAQSYPTAANGSDPGRQGWTVRVENTFGGGGAAGGQAVAICVEAAQSSGTWP